MGNDDDVSTRATIYCTSASDNASLSCATYHHVDHLPVVELELLARGEGESERALMAAVGGSDFRLMSIVEPVKSGGDGPVIVDRRWEVAAG